MDGHVYLGNEQIFETMVDLDDWRQNPVSVRIIAECTVRMNSRNPPTPALRSISTKQKYALTFVCQSSSPSPYPSLNQLHSALMTRLAPSLSTGTEATR